jgi:hypothetical protein
MLLDLGCLIKCLFDPIVHPVWLDRYKYYPGRLLLGKRQIVIVTGTLENKASIIEFETFKNRRVDKYIARYVIANSLWLAL